MGAIIRNKRACHQMILALQELRDLLRIAPARASQPGHLRLRAPIFDGDVSILICAKFWPAARVSDGPNIELSL